MTNNPLDELVRCDIDMSSPASNDQTFDQILIVVPGPTKTTGVQSISGVLTIASAKELTDFGFEKGSAAYEAATTAFGQNPAPATICVVVREKKESANEDIGDTLDRASTETVFYGFHITEYRAKEDVEKAAKWAEENKKLFAYEYTDYANNPIKTATYAYTYGMYSGDADVETGSTLPEGNNYAALGLMAKCFGYQPGSETWHLKQLVLVAPSLLNTTKKTALDTANINTFRRYAGKNVSYGGKVLAGEWIDVIRFRDWLKAEIQINVFNALIKNPKVPFTDEGISVIENAVEAALMSGQQNGGIAPDESDEDGNMVPGYTLNVPRATSLTESDRNSRKLKNVHWSARLAGAIHLVEISGNLTY